MIAAQSLLLFVLCFLACQQLFVVARAEENNQMDFFTAVQSSVRQAEIEITKVILEYEEQYPRLKNYLLEQSAPKPKAQVEPTKYGEPQESATPEPMYGSPTRMPTFASDSYCRSLTTFSTNVSTTDQCSTCLSAQCIWCESGNYCFSSNTDGCSSSESGSPGICSVDLSGLALLIIIIIIFAVIVPCCACGVGVLVLCFGVSVCCFTASKGNNNNANNNNTYNNNTPNVVQGQAVGAQQPYATNNPMIISAASPAYGASGTVVHGQVVGSMDMEGGKNMM